jgi:hypothetical protein
VKGDEIGLNWRIGPHNKEWSEKLVRDGKELSGKARVRKPACDELISKWCSRGMEPLRFSIYYFLFSI